MAVLGYQRPHPASMAKHLQEKSRRGVIMYHWFQACPSPWTSSLVPASTLAFAAWHRHRQRLRFCCGAGGRATHHLGFALWGGAACRNTEGWVLWQRHVYTISLSFYIHRSICLSIFLYLFLFVYLSDLFVCLSINLLLPIHLSIHLPIYLPKYRSYWSNGSIDLSIDLSIYLSIDLVVNIHLGVY